MSSPGPEYFDFAGFRLYPQRRELLGTDGKPVSISAKAFDVLLYLIEHAGQLVERSALFDAVWPGVVVDDNNLNQAISALRRLLGHDSIVTIARRGYQFVATVRRYPEGATAGRERRATGWRPYLAIGTFVAVGGAAIIATPLLTEAPETESQPIIAALPCQNSSPKDADAYYAQAFHSELISDLSKIGGLAVIASSSVMRYADSDAGIAEIARDTHATGIIECSVRVDGGKVLISAELIAPDTEAIVWSNSYSGTLDVGLINTALDDIAVGSATAVHAKILPAEQRRIEKPPTRSHEAYALLLRGRQAQKVAQITNPFSPKALELFDAAIAEDPQFALAYIARSAYRYNRARAADGMGDRAVDVAQELELARGDAERAVALDPDLPEGHVALAVLARLDGDRATADTHLTRASEIAPSDAGVLMTRAEAALLDGHKDEAAAIVERLQVVEPNAFLGPMLVAVGKLEDAIRWLHAYVEANPDSDGGYALLGVVEALHGDSKNALEHLRLGEALFPDGFRLADGSADLTLTDFLLPISIYAYGHLLGREEDAGRLFDRLLEGVGDQSQDLSPRSWMLAYLGVGDTDAAYEAAVRWSKKPVIWPGDLQDIAILNFQDPAFSEPRFQEVLSRLRLGR
jgi:DNA-binding winged helix-turn-helix (wHTH) protein/TolB-like protein/Flp pilus assembly protein TadD